MNRNHSHSDIGAWLSAGMALAPVLGALAWAISATSVLGFA